MAVVIQLVLQAFTRRPAFIFLDLLDRREVHGAFANHLLRRNVKLEAHLDLLFVDGDHFSDLFRVVIHNLVDLLLFILAQELLDRDRCTWTHVYLNLRQATNDRLVLALLNSFEGSEHTQYISTLLVFFDRLQSGIVMLLVGEKDVIQKRTLTRQEGARDFKCLRMPEFALQLSLFLNFWLQVLGS